MSECHARQYSDQMACKECGVAWDMNDPEPPKCEIKLELYDEDTKKIIRNGCISPRDMSECYVYRAREYMENGMSMIEAKKQAEKDLIINEIDKVQSISGFKIIMMMLVGKIYEK